MLDPQWATLIGQRIVEIHPRPFDDGRGGTAYDPMLVLENGAKVFFSVQETSVPYRQGINIITETRRER